MLSQVPAEISHGRPYPNLSSPLYPHAGYLISISHLVLIIILLSFASPHGACTQLERNSLLSFLSGLSSTPNNTLLSSWGVEDCCLWEGVSCNGDNGSVTQLWLPLRGLKGPISPALVNLGNLSHLNLSCNSFSGALPSALLWSDNLVVLDVSFNSLSGELSTSPPPPSSVGGSRARALQVLNVSGNLFTGELPSIGWAAENLVEIDLSNNSLTGPIPSAPCGESPLIQSLNIQFNGFSGEVPVGLGNCSQLRVFEAGFNNLTGQLPSELFDVLSLQQLSLPYNQLQGILDWERIANLSNLTLLDLSSNSFSGPLPEIIGKLAKLEQLILFGNSLSGALPSALSNCTKLTILSLRSNSFSENLTAVNFSSFPNLTVLDLGNNSFIGGIPESIFSCRSLIALRLSRNSLRGEIAPSMSNLRALSFLSLSHNMLVNISGAFQVLKNCKNLSKISITGNFIGEAMPEADWGDGFQNVRFLSIGSCMLTGKIPAWLAKLGKLEFLNLSYNQLTGSVPDWLGSLAHLFVLDLSNNFLSGEFPLGITKLRALGRSEGCSPADEGPLELPVFVTRANASSLQYNRISHMPPAINLRNNSLSGVMPPEIGQLKMLHRLDLGINNFSGEIPVQLSDLINLETLDLSENHLSGMIPPGLSGLHFLASFSVAYNDLEGPVPSGGQFDTFPLSSFEGNPNLCGSAVKSYCTSHSGESSTSSTKGHKKKLLIVVVAVAVGIIGGASVLVSLACCVMFLTRANHPGGAIGDENMSLDAISSNSISRLPSGAAARDCTLIMVSRGSGGIFKDLTFADILKATNDFDQSNIVGCGGFGLVYRATFANGTKLAIKRLSGDMCLMEREFRAEVEALSMARHENLVALQGYCIQGNFGLLIYPYMEKGSLDDWLHERDDGASELDWPIRLRIALGAGRGLAHIHQTCQPHIVHRDIKSSNILLDHEFKAYLADFGLSRLIVPHNTHVSTELVGTLGYIPPEYGLAWVATLRGDIYSFGVVMLELLTGRRPVEVLPNHSEELVGWVQQMREQGKQDEVFDPLLQGKGFEAQIRRVLGLACKCVNEDPFKRPRINEVVSWLENAGTKLQAEK